VLNRDSRGVGSTCYGEAAAPANGRPLFGWAVWRAYGSKPHSPGSPTYAARHAQRCLPGDAGTKAPAVGPLESGRNFGLRKPLHGRAAESAVALAGARSPTACLCL
jgi:hypothetical protein